ncbi:MAG TPA: thioredoxin [Anaerolineae bacterium]
MPIDAPIHTGESNLPKVLKAGLPVALVFWQRDCAPCEQWLPTLDRLARSYAGRALIVKVNAAEEANLAERYQIAALPSVVFIKDGRELATAQGAAGEQALASWLDYLTGRGSQPPVPAGPSVPLRVAAGAGAYAGSPAAAAGPAPAAAGAGPNGGGHPVTLTDANFDQILRTSQVPVMVDFWAVWCGPCKMVAPTVEQLARDYAGRAVVGKLNVDENPGVAERYGIMSIPTLMIFRNGEVVDRLIGAHPGPVLRQHLAAQVR